MKGKIVNEPKTEQTDKPKKPRAKRRASNYLVLRQVLNGPTNNTPTYEQVAPDGSLKGCLKAIVDQKITGDLMVVCVRRKFVTSVQEVLKFS